jgi:hypothetical protein
VSASPSPALLAADDQRRAATADARARSAELCNDGAALLDVAGPWVTAMVVAACAPGGRRIVCATLSAARGPLVAVTFAAHAVVCWDCAQAVRAPERVRSCSACHRTRRAGDLPDLVAVVAQHETLLICGDLCGTCLSAERLAARARRGPK